MSEASKRSSMRVSIIIASFGADPWRQLAESRALPSAQIQGAHEVLIGHDFKGTISSVRNELAAKAQGDWLCFLDADDELAPGYLDAMRQAQEEQNRSALLLTPAVSYVRKRGIAEAPRFWPECSLTTGNWLVIGTLVEKWLFEKVGGFEDWAWSEDWALWARCVKEGAVPVKVPEAIYRAHRAPRNAGRNHALPRHEVLRVYEEIRQAVWG